MPYFSDSLFILMLFITSCLILALVLDRLLGEPKQWHPLVGFGKLANLLEKTFYSNTSSAAFIFIKGILAWALAVIPITLCFVYLNSFFADQNRILLVVLNSFGLYFCIGAKSLEQHVLAIRDELQKKNIAAARDQLSRIVSRDTQQLGEQQIISATIESTLENGSDAIFAALFWFVIGGLPAAIAYRLINTLDAMWGYKNERYFYFGKFAARVDDVMNFIPARLTALSYCIAGHFRSGWLCWRQQATQWKSPNAGPVMAAGAGALNITIGGNAMYHGAIEQKPSLGVGPEPVTEDISRALQLIHRSLFLWIIVITLASFVIFY